MYPFLVILISRLVDRAVFCQLLHERVEDFIRKFHFVWDLLGLGFKVNAVDFQLVCPMIVFLEQV
jgi:hypothetical protein